MIYMYTVCVVMVAGVTPHLSHLMLTEKPHQQHYRSSLCAI